MTQHLLALGGDHLWQSTLAIAVVWLLTLVVRNARARVRCWLWIAASLKFLAPFSLFIALGSSIHWRKVPPPPERPAVTAAMDHLALPFTPPAITSPVLASVPRGRSELPEIVIFIWLAGALLVAVRWLIPWLRIRNAARTALPLDLALEIPAVSSKTLQEPGVFGIFQPVLILPKGMAEALTPAQWNAIVLHELCHVRRRDNLTAALHMLVETLFWFHPLVWWIGNRMVEERERACDEQVLELSVDPRAYAEGIFKVCELYLASPSRLVSSVSGANLKRRLENILARRMGGKMNRIQKVLLAGCGCAALAGPFLFGLANAVPLRAEDPPRAIEAASIRPAIFPSDDYFRGWTARGDICDAGARRPTPSGNRISLARMTLCELIVMGYGIQGFRIKGAPQWMMQIVPGNYYNVEIKAEGDAPLSDDQARGLLRALVADRFRVTLHRDTRSLPVYVLAVGRNGPKFQETSEDGRPQRNGVRIASYIAFMSDYVDRPIVDKTGLTGSHYEFKFDQTELRAELQRGIKPVPSIFHVVEEQLGLTLKPSNEPIDVLVIDHAERPSEN